MSDAIKIQDLSFTWPRTNPPTLYIPQFTLADRQRLFLLGASGSGKSTLLKIIAGLMLPDSGSVEVLGAELSVLSNRQRDAFRTKHIGFVFQQFNLIPYLDIEHNVLMSSRLSGMKMSQFRGKLKYIMDSLSLPHSLMSRRADSLSTGQQQRAAIARAIINSPSLIIADEPTSALDEDARDEFVKLLLDTSSDTGASVLFVSHDKQLAQYFDTVQKIHDINSIYAQEPA